MTDHLIIKLQYYDDKTELLLPLQLDDFIDSYEGISKLEHEIMTFIETVITEHDLIKDYLEEMESDDEVPKSNLHFSLFKEGHIFIHEDNLSLDGTTTIQDVRSKILSFFSTFKNSIVPIKEFYANYYLAKNNSTYEKVTKDIFLGTSNAENINMLIVGVTNIFTNMRNNYSNVNYILELLCLDSITQSILKYKFIPIDNESLNLEEIRKFFQ